MPRACNTVLLVGEDNPQSTDPRHALYPYPPRCAGERLCNDILDLSTGTYLAIWRTNLCGGRWNKREASDRSDVLLAPAAPWRTVILLGKKVKDTFRFTGDFFSVHNYQHPTLGSEHTWKVISLPHPSGRNLVWNSQAVRDNARALIQEHVPGLWESEAI